MFQKFGKIPSNPVLGYFRSHIPQVLNANTQDTSTESFSLELFILVIYKAIIKIRKAQPGNEGPPKEYCRR